tara:strand:+ start:384 stop:740 length:357 start_codon:yes stop_codon:yes gene_type:complete
MSLESIENTIHEYNCAELLSNIDDIISDIQTELAAESDPINTPVEHYYINHTGRELFRKLFYCGHLAKLSEIGDDYDDGFRPLTIAGIKAYGTGATFRILAENGDFLMTEDSDNLRQE